MFTWLNKQGVRSTGGFEVQFTGRFGAEYREGGKVLSFDVEAGMTGGLQCIIVDPAAFERWDGDPPGVSIAPERQTQMLDNLRQALEFQDLKLVIEQAEE